MSALARSSAAARQASAALSGSNRSVGGRMQSNPATVTVFGASGFLGRYLVNALGRVGTTVFLPTRDTDMSVRHMKPLQVGDYGKINPKFISFEDEESLRNAMQHSDAVVNLIGKKYATSHYLPWLINNTIEDSNVETARTIARLASELGVEHLVHVSALGCGEDSISQWSRAKAASEAAVLTEFPTASIVRTASMYGSEDRFLNTYATFAKLLPAVPLMEGGAARQQPVFVGDVGQAVARTVLNKELAANTTFNLAGPDEYTVKQIFEFIFEASARKPQLVDVPNQALEMIGLAVEQGYNPWITRDEFCLMREDSILGAAPNGFDELGITPASFEVASLPFLSRFKPGGNYRYAPD